MRNRSGMHMTERVQNEERSGFTLLELLVAISILVIIIMMMSGVFHQSRIAWNSGLRKARMNMGGRAVVDFMSRELSQAIADDTLPCLIEDNKETMGFYMLADPDASANKATRSIQWVEYALSGGTEIHRRIRPVDSAGTYPNKVGVGVFKPLVKGVKRFKIYTSDGLSHTTNLPLWVEILVELEHPETVSKIRCASAGPDGSLGTPDDIWSDD